MNRARIALAALMCLTAAANAYAQARNGAGAQSPQSGTQSSSQTTNERVAAGLRSEADDFEQRLQRSGMVNHDPALNAEIHRIGCLIAQERCTDLRFYVVETSVFNASMSANGMMMINSGLLLRCETEAELVFVMAHEFHHFTDNDSVDMASHTRSANRSGVIAMTVLGGGLLGELAYLAAVSNVLAYSRDQERQADMSAIDFVNAHGYDTVATVHTWENLRAEIQASSNAQTRKRFDHQMFSDHPMTNERIAYLRAAQRLHPDGGVDKAAYRAMIRPNLRHWLEAEVAARDPGATLNLLDRLASQGTDLGVIQYIRGEVYRYRDGAGDAAHALESYTAASGHDDAPPETWRQIGVMQHKANNAAAADAAFHHYLELSPNAPDRALIAMMISAPSAAPTPEPAQPAPSTSSAVPAPSTPEPTHP